MPGCGRYCFVLGGAFVTFLAISLYPLSQWDEGVSMDTRIGAVILNHILPTDGYNLCSLIGLLTGTSQMNVSRNILNALGRSADVGYVNIEEHTVAGVHVRLYRPQNIDRHQVLPVVIYFHGGGFVTGSLDAYNIGCSKLCNESKNAVVSVDYRLAPEHVFPAAFEDCFGVTKAILGDSEVAARLAVNSLQVSVSGDSAGGNLAVAVALHIGRTDLPPLRSQVVLYPTLRSVFTDLEAAESHSSPGSLTPDGIFLVYSHYLGGVDGGRELCWKLLKQCPTLLPRDIWKNAALRLEGADVELIAPSAEEYPYAERFLNDSLTALLAKDLSKMPPALVILAGIDPLYSDGILYQQRLRSAGVEAEVVEYPMQIHAFAAAIPSNINMFGVHFRYGNKEAQDAMERSTKFVLEHQN